MNSIEKAPFGQLPDRELPPKLVEVDNELLSSINDGINQLIDESGIRESIANNSSTAALYKGCYNGVSFHTKSSEDSYTICMGKGKRFLHIGYDTKESIVTNIIEHNFDENGYKNIMKEWIPCTILAGLDNAKSVGALDWNITN